MEVTEKTVQFSGGKDANDLRTLAAAYAEVGQFSETIATAEQALQIATAQGKSGSATILEKKSSSTGRIRRCENRGPKIKLIRLTSRDKGDRPPWVQPHL
jgi:hypothetical protein